MHGATVGIPTDHIMLRAVVVERHYATARDCSDVAVSIGRWWLESIAADLGRPATLLGAVVEVGTEIVVVLPDGRMRLVADLIIGRARVVATLLGAVAEPDEWAMRPATEWPS